MRRCITRLLVTFGLVLAVTACGDSGLVEAGSGLVEGQTGGDDAALSGDVEGDDHISFEGICRIDQCDIDEGAVRRGRQAKVWGSTWRASTATPHKRRRPRRRQDSARIARVCIQDHPLHETGIEMLIDVG